MNKIKHQASINIIRDSNKSLNYIPTLNATKTANFIVEEFERGIHSFNIIGSYGTGKSSFLWAFNKSINIKDKINYFKLPTSNLREVQYINIVGEYNSLIDYFKSYFSIENKFKGNQEIFDSIFSKYKSINEKNGLLIIYIDEFGKFLEYASHNNPEREMYFIQQLAEFVNDSSRKIILITSVHQAIDSYAQNLSYAQKNEWRKVKGRLHEITFNEPVEQLLYLAAQHFKKKYSNKAKNEAYLKKLVKLNSASHCFTIGEKYVNNIWLDLYPLDIISAIVLTFSLQRYGQNERSLFSFLETSDHLGISSLKKDELFDLPKLYDYLFVNLYSILISKHNPDYSQWALIKDSIERSETQIDNHQDIANDLLKVIGLLNLFSNKGGIINEELLAGYLSYKYEKKNVLNTIKALTKFKIIRFNEFNKSFKLFGGTDLDIEDALNKVGKNIDDSIDIVSKLNETFEFPVITAREVTYLTGTPRLFQFEISDKPIIKTPEDEVDGFINLIFNENIKEFEISEISKNNESATLYGYYKNTSTIRKTLLDILKTEKVLKNVEPSDTFAKEELRIIINSQKALLNHYVLDSLYSNKIHWYFNGVRKVYNTKQALNKGLSDICKAIYPLTPIINMELINKHKVSGAINTSRKSYFKSLVNHWNEKDLGYPSDKFPSDKTIYWSLIKNNGIHRKEGNGFILTKPNTKNKNLLAVWEECESFLEEAKKENKQITELIETLKSKPYKLKQGVIDFFIPTFLFAKRGDFALYNIDGGYLPYLTETVLYLITRNPKEFSVKSFELNDLRLSLFNKYRNYLQQDNEEIISNESFIESIRPFLILYKGLTTYSQKTKRLSKEALKLREAIANATDPEKVFFENFPKALGVDVKELMADERKFDDYILDFQKTILEIKNSFDELLNRLENYLTKEILGVNSQFPKYKKILQKRFASIKEHQTLPSQKTFMLRINSDLNDRNSWLISICFALLGKPLDKITDKEEEILKDKLSFIIKELDNLCEIKNVIFDESKEEVYKIDFTSQNEGLKKHLIRVSKEKQNEIEKGIVELEKKLGKDKNTRIAILSKLLQKELNNE
jgi:hypothetical protein